MSSKLQTLLSQKLSHEVNLITTYSGYLNNSIDIYQGSHPEQTKIIKKLIEDFDKKTTEKLIQAIGTFSELEISEQIKLLFKIESAFDDIHDIISQITNLLYNVDIKSSVSSSTTAYAYDYIKKMIDNITTLNTKHQIYLEDIRPDLYNNYVDVLFSSKLFTGDVKNETIEQLSEIISTTYKKYPKSKYLYAAILNNITQKYPVYGKKLISEIEILKDESLQIKIDCIKNSCVLMNMMQHYDLMPDGPYRKLDVLLGEFNIKASKLEEASKLLSSQKPTGFIIINRIPENWDQTCEYKIWNIVCSNNLDRLSNLDRSIINSNIDPDFGIDKNTLDSFNTIQNIKVNKTKNFIKYVGVSNPSLVIVLDNLNDTYRVLSPWNIFPYTKSTNGIPANWLDVSMNKHPAIRVMAYNKHFESEVLKYVGEAKEFPDIDNEESVLTARAKVIEKLSEWFDKKITVTLDSFREKMLSEEVSDIFYESIMDSLGKFDKHENVYFTCLSVANQLTNKFTREMAYQVKSFKSNVFNELNMENLKSYLRTYFREMLDTIMEIIITDNTMFNIIVMKKETYPTF